jgi:hypothetical protein
MLLSKTYAWCCAPAHKTREFKVRKGTPVAKYFFGMKWCSNLTVPAPDKKKPKEQKIEMTNASAAIAAAENVPKSAATESKGARRSVVTCLICFRAFFSNRCGCGAVMSFVLRPFKKFAARRFPTRAPRVTPLSARRPLAARRVQVKLGPECVRRNQKPSLHGTKP